MSEQLKLDLEKLHGLIDVMSTHGTFAETATKTYQGTRSATLVLSTSAKAWHGRGTGR